MSPAKTKAKRAAPEFVFKPIPQSWFVSKWDTLAPDVPPHGRAAAKHMIRHHLDELERAGALTRHGRELTVWGEEYMRWLRRGAARRAVKEYEIAANRGRR